MRVIERIQLGVLTVNRQSVLGQVIRSHTEEIHFLRQLTADHDRSRCLDHNAELNLISVWDSLTLQLFLHFRDDRFDLVDLIYRNDHREHDGYITIHRRAVQCAKLCLEDLRSCQADTDRTVTKRRVLLFVKSEVIHLLVSTNVKRTDDNLLACHILRYLLVNRELLLLCREICILQIQELTAEQTDSACVILEHCSNIRYISDVRVHIDLLTALCNILLAFELLQKRFLLQILLTLLLHHFHGLFIRFDIKRPCKTVNDRHLPVVLRKKILSETDHCRYIHCTCQDRSMGVG